MALCSETTSNGFIDDDSMVFAAAAVSGFDLRSVVYSSNKLTEDLAFTIAFFYFYA